MTIERSQFNKFLEEAAQELDISPSKYKQAVERYQAVGKWLDSAEYPKFDGETNIYPQGSFRLGTVVRPIREQKEQEYDIDLVCEFDEQVPNTTPEEIKSRVGNRLKENETYKRMLDHEGRRCWTLIYSEQDSIGFHLDVLPAIFGGNAEIDSSISITHKDDNNYRWSVSNPKGYANWFEGINRNAFLLAERTQKRAIVLKAQDIYANVEDVPDQLVRTPLQRAIQIMKRHRDTRFDINGESKIAPISMIITTLAAHLYDGETDVLSALTGIISKLDAHHTLLADSIIANESLAQRSLIRRYDDGAWYIGNPANPKENFADRWHEDNHARAKAFFEWVTWLRKDFVQIFNTDETTAKEVMNKRLGSNIVNLRWPFISTNIDQPSIPTPRKVNIQAAPKPWRK